MQRILFSLLPFFLLAALPATASLQEGVCEFRACEYRWNSDGNIFESCSEQVHRKQVVKKSAQDHIDNQCKELAAEWLVGQNMDLFEAATTSGVNTNRLRFFAQYTTPSGNQGKVAPSGDEISPQRRFKFCQVRRDGSNDILFNELTATKDACQFIAERAIHEGQINFSLRDTLNLQWGRTKLHKLQVLNNLLSKMHFQKYQLNRANFFNNDFGSFYQLPIPHALQTHISEAHKPDFLFPLPENIAMYFEPDRSRTDSFGIQVMHMVYLWNSNPIIEVISEEEMEKEINDQILSEFKGINPETLQPLTRGTFPAGMNYIVYKYLRDHPLPDGLSLEEFLRLMGKAIQVYTELYTSRAATAQATVGGNHLGHMGSWALSPVGEKIFDHLPDEIQPMRERFRSAAPETYRMYFDSAFDFVQSELRKEYLLVAKKFAWNGLFSALAHMNAIDLSEPEIISVTLDESRDIKVLLGPRPIYREPMPESRQIHYNRLKESPFRLDFQPKTVVASGQILGFASITKSEGILTDVGVLVGKKFEDTRREFFSNLPGAVKTIGAVAFAATPVGQLYMLYDSAKKLSTPIEFGSTLQLPRSLVTHRALPDIDETEMAASQFSQYLSTVGISHEVYEKHKVIIKSEEFPCIGGAYFIDFSKDGHNYYVSDQFDLRNQSDSGQYLQQLQDSNKVEPILEAYFFAGAFMSARHHVSGNAGLLRESTQIMKTICDLPDLTADGTPTVAQIVDAMKSAPMEAKNIVKEELGKRQW